MTEMIAIVPALAAGGDEAFELEDLRAEGDDLVITLRRAVGDGRVDLVVGAAGDHRAVWRGERCGVRYTTRLEHITTGERDALRDLIVAFGGGVEQWLEASAKTHPREMLEGLSSGARRVVLTPEGLLGLLGLRTGAELPGGWRLAAVYPSSMISEVDAAHRALVIELTHAVDGTLRVEVGARNDEVRAFARSAHLDISYLTLGSSPPPSAARAMRLLGLLLRLRDVEELEVELVSNAASHKQLGAGAPIAALPTSQTVEWLNLAINSPCAQACQFCSVLDVSPPWTDTLRHERLLLDLRSNAEAGVRRVRINGYDPLTYPRILEVAEAIRELRYEEVLVFSPCTELSDEARLDALLEALPPTVSFHIPVYGAVAAVHDRVVGRGGAFARVSEAIGLIGARIPRERIVITSVAVEDNVAHLVELRRWALERAVRFHVQTAYPSSESPTDRFRTSAPSFRRIAEETLHQGDEPLVVNGVPPCVYFERSVSEGVDPRRWIVDEARPLPGREYLADPISHRSLLHQHSVSVPGAVVCPHRARCALAVACPGEVLASYADRHGMDELAPVRLRSLLDARRPA